MSCGPKTLSAEQWAMIISLPADGKVYHVEGVAFRAIHSPKTNLTVENVRAETQYGVLRRLFINGRWGRTDYISSL